MNARPQGRPAVAGGLTFVLALGAYAMTLCPTVYTEGSGELIGATYLLGTPHPTGYPLFVLLGRVVAVLLPFSSPALEINAATALVAAAAAAAVAALLCWRGTGTVAGIVGGLALAWGRVYWGQAVIAEVYGLFVGATVAAIAACLQAAQRPTRRWRVLAGYACGVAATTHLQAILALPMAVMLALRPSWREARARHGWPWRSLAEFAAAAAVGLSLWLYLPLRNGRGTAFHWGELSSATSLWRHLTAAEYRSSFFSQSVRMMERNGEHFFRLLWQEWTVVGPGLIAAGIWWGWHRDRRLLAVIAAAVGLNLLTALNYHRDPAGLDVFFLLALLGGVLLLGAGADLIGGWRPRGLPLGLGCALLLPLGIFLQHRSDVDRSHSWLADQYGRDLLSFLPRDSVLLAEGDDVAFVLDYLLRVEGVRPDVELFNRQGRGTDLGTAAGTSPQQQRRARALGEKRLWLAGRDIFTVVARRPPVEGLHFEPHGLVYRLVDGAVPGGGVGPAVDAAARIRAATAGRPIEDPWLAKLAANYWFMAGERQRALASPAAAVRAYREAVKTAPRSQSTLFNVALRLLQFNLLSEAYEIAGKAISVDPSRPGPYRLAAQILRRQGAVTELEVLNKRARDWGVFP